MRTAREKSGFKAGLRRADETNPALSVDRKHLGTSTIGSHPARPAPAVAPRDPPRSAVACRSANPEGGGYVAGGGKFDRVPLPTSLAISWWRTAPFLE